MKYKKIDPILFIKNRKKIACKIEDNSLVVLLAADQMPRNGDLFFPYRQNSDFFYLTGIEQEKSKLLLIKTNEAFQSILFIIEPDKKTEIWEGKKLTIEAAADISGISEIRYLKDFDNILESYLQRTTTIYLNYNDNPRFSSSVKTGDLLLIEQLERDYDDFQFNALAPIMTQLRVQKEPEEIELIKHACTITNSAFHKVLKKTAPGMKEYEIEAEISYEFYRLGANGHAYEPIIAAGINSCFLHYTKNDCSLGNGDILFMDFGAEYANYSSDCSRAIPVSGTFTERQKDVYSAVLRVLRKAIALIKPGTTIMEYHKKVCTYIEEECINLGLFSAEDVRKQRPDKPLYFKYYMHGTSHFMGLDTHDLGDREMILKPGMIVSCEPGIYIMEESIGIRLENDILVTEYGNIDLMADIPVEIADIEALMRS